jgi:hypothetical protein
MDVWGGAFNGQERRQALFDQLLRNLKIVTIVETGTYREPRRRTWPKLACRSSAASCTRVISTTPRFASPILLISVSSGPIADVSQELLDENLLAS